ncbi:MAG: phosphatidate cytidylyltransferase, partial [Sphingomonadales bacterium]
MIDEVKPRSDLGVRTLSGVVMMGVAALAIWIGGWAFRLFILLVAVGLLREWLRLAWKLRSDIAGRLVWAVGGVLYIGLATAILAFLRETSELYMVLTIIGVVIATDTGAYFAGRAIGGPKIAPR